MQCEDTEQLLRLTQLSSLRHLALHYTRSAKIPAATAAAWQHLQQLQELSLKYKAGGAPTEQQLMGILAGVAASTQLTKLEFAAAMRAGGQVEGEDEDDGSDVDYDGFLRVAACTSLAGLTRLRHLAFPQAYMVPCDPFALTALTALTHLDLRSADEGVDDVVANALACSLKQLCYLDLSYCDLGSMVCMAAIGHLSQLTALKLGSVQELTERGLMLLTGLQSLQVLEVQQNAEVTTAVLDRFWAALRQQRH